MATKNRKASLEIDDPRFAAMVAALSRRKAFRAIVDEHLAARRGGGARFGKNALRVSNKIFAMMTRGELVVKLPQDRVDALVTSGDGAPFDANKGKPMREWVRILSTSKLAWVEIATEAREFVER